MNYELRIKNNSGQILTELIIAIAITAILAAIGAQLIGVSFYSAGTSEERQAASRLADEVFESLRAITQGNTSSTQGWNRLYLPPDGTGTSSSSKGATNFYKVLILDSTWQIASGTESIILDGSEYIRSFSIYNVSRDATNGNIDTDLNYNIANDDPATQKVIVKITKTNGQEFTFEKYFTRYLNESTPQTTWSSSGCGPYGATSSQANWCFTDGNIDTNAYCVDDSTCFRLHSL